MSDTFNRANSSSLGTASTGQAWTVYAGSASIQSNVAKLGSNYSLAAVNAGASPGAVQVRVPAIAGEFWLIVRLADGANYWRFGRWQSGNYILQQVQNNALGNPAIQTPAAAAPAAGDLLRCDLLAAGLSCSVNGTVVASTTNTFNATATRAGFAGYLASTASFDDFLITSSAPPVATPDLSVSLTGPASGSPGGSLSWTATVQNVGSASAPAAELRVTQPAGQPTLTFPGVTCTPEATFFRCPLNSLAAGAATTVTIQLSPLAAAASVNIAANVPAVAGETNTSQNSASLLTNVRPAIPAGAIVIDRFDRTDGALGDTETGQPWTHFGQPLNIQNQMAAPSDGFVLSAVQSPIAPNLVRVIVEQVATEFWLVVRLENSSNYWRFGRAGGGAYQLQQIVNSSVSTAGISTLASIKPAAADVLTCNLSVSAISCDVNGTAAASASSAAGGTALGLGLSASQSGGARFDDLAATGVAAVPDMSVSLTGPASAFTSSSASWTASVRNESAAAQTAHLVFTVPTSLTQVQIAGFSCSQSQSTTWSCPLGSVSPGQTVSVTLQAQTPASAGQVVLTAAVPAAQGETQTANNTASFTTQVTQPPSGGGTQILTDDFDRSAANGLGTATSGQVWTSHAGSFAIATNQASPGTGFGLVSIDAGASTLDARVTLAAPAAEFWLILRFTDSQNYWRFGRWQNQTYQLQRVVNNALAAPAVQYFATLTPAAGDRLACTTASTGISCSVNGTLVLSTMDSSGAAATRLGLSGYQASAARFDDLAVFGQAAVPAPNPEVSVTQPHHVLVGEQHTVQVTVRNAGTSASASGTLQVSIPASILVNSVPAGCTGQVNYTCTVPALAAGAPQNFAFTLTSNEGTPFTGQTTVTVPGDTVPAGNTAAWKTYTHVSGASILDRFNRSNTSSGLGTAPSGQAWTSLAAGFRISNNMASAPSAGAFARINTGYAFGTIEAVMGSTPATTAIVFRVVDVNNYYRLGVDQDGYYALRKVINGVAYPLALGYTRDWVRPAAGDRVRIITRPDDGVFVAVNGTQIIDMGDPALMNATGWGIAAIGGPASVDEFTVNPKFEGYITYDNFSGPDGQILWQPTYGVKYRWIDWVGGYWTLSGERAHGNVPDYTFTWIDTTSERAAVQATLAQPGEGAYVIFRFDETNNTYFRFGHTGGTYAVQWMYRHIVNAMPVAVQSFAAPAAQAGDILQVLQLPNGTVECYVNGSLTHRFIDPNTNARWTLYGLGAQGSAALLDDFLVTPYSR